MYYSVGIKRIRNIMKTKTLVAITAMMGALAVGLGAFGAHALKNMLSPEAMSWFHTAGNYHFIHVLAALGSVSYLRRHKSSNKNLPVYFFLTGILLFSGSLYAMAFISIDGGITAWLGPVTPIGGVLFLLGWLNLFYLALTYE